MKILDFDAVCDLCGGPGIGTIRVAGAAWDDNYLIYHVDRAECDLYIRRAQRIEADPVLYLKKLAGEELHLAQWDLTREVRRIRAELGLQEPS